MQIRCKQSTIKIPVNFTGIGVHTGEKISITLKPAPENHGICFIRTDLVDNNKIKVHCTNIHDTQFCTTIANNKEASVSTIEHILSALSALQISNLNIEISGIEMPILDGSAQTFYDKIKQIGITEQSTYHSFIKIRRAVEITENNRKIRLEPSNEINFNFTLDFNKRQQLKVQQHNFNFLQDDFGTNIAGARSFGFLEDAQKMHEIGLAKGTSLENAVIIDKGKVVNKDGLRFNNEMVRHKILDTIGDFYLCGHLIWGNCIAHNPGHELNYRILEKLLDDKSNYSLEYFDKNTDKSIDSNFQSLFFTSKSCIKKDEERVFC